MIARRVALRALTAASAAAGLALAAAQPLAAGDVEGSYCLRGVMEVGSCLKLSAGGTFEYFLAYGAYDETSGGRWKLEGGDVVLDSPAYDKAARFAFTGREAGEGAGFGIVVRSSRGQPLSGISVRAACDGRTVEAGVTGAEGYEVKCASAPTQVSLGLDMYGVPFQTIGVDGKAGSGKIFVFEFDPGDLGKKRFAGTHLKRQGASSLVMTYSGSPIPELEGKPFTYEKE
jgi:hypothetical protein